MKDDTVLALEENLLERESCWSGKVIHPSKEKQEN